MSDMDIASTCSKHAVCIELDSDATVHFHTEVLIESDQRTARSNSVDQFRNVESVGAVYTPPLLAEWVAEILCRNLPAESANCVLDPACGDGALLKAIRDQTTPVRLVGVDIDHSALVSAQEQLPADTELHQADALAPGGKDRSPREGWRMLLEGCQPTGLIANPPWGADVNYSATELRSLGYELANGQFDSFDLFVEICLSLVSERTTLAFILPDAVFSPEHQALRVLLLRSTRLLLIARLGEGFFPGVYRGTSVVVVKKETPSVEHYVECFRLTKSWRKRVLNREATLEQARDALVHEVPQSRFSEDPMARFDIDVKRQDETFLNLLSELARPWTRWLQSGRGVELSKSGKVVICPQCGRAHPLPQKEKYMTCAGCRNTFASSGAEQQSIVLALDESRPGWQPLIAGEDVDRYRCSPSRQICLDVAGINYKAPETFRNRKLLIRKTGLGIKAAIDDSGAYTNQVVFHYFVPTGSEAPPFFLDYLQGVLCSRVMLAYHLKRLGENEWRSHPYVTQKVISQLPIPVFREGTWQWKQAQAIADAAERRRGVERNDSEEDVYVECLVAGLYGLKKSDFTWVLDVLDTAEPLEPIRALHLSRSTELKPIRVK